MSWNFRVVRVDGQGFRGGPLFTICEVLYSRRGVPHGYSEAGPPIGEQSHGILSATEPPARQTERKKTA